MSTQYVIGPDGSPITKDDLPSGRERWTVKRKAIVLAAIRGGLLTLAEAGERYRFSAGELARMGELIDRHGDAGLRQTQIQRYRHET